MRAAAALMFALLAASAAHAHPGHGIAELWHLLTEPDHLALLLLPLAIGIGAWFSRRKNGVRAEISVGKIFRP